MYKYRAGAVDSVTQLVEASSCTTKSWGFDSRSEHMPRSWVEFPVTGCMGRSQSTFLTSMFLPLSLSLPLSLKSINILLKLKKIQGGKSRFTVIRTWNSFFLYYLFIYYCIIYLCYFHINNCCEPTLPHLSVCFVSAFGYFVCVPRSAIVGSHGGSTFNFRGELPACFPQRLHHFTFPPAVNKCSTFLPTLVTLSFGGGFVLVCFL